MGDEIFYMPNYNAGMDRKRTYRKPQRITLEDVYWRALRDTEDVDVSNFSCKDWDEFIQQKQFIDFFRRVYG